MVGEEDFRRVMGHFSTGVTVVCSRKPDGDPVGLTVNAFTSVSLDPPLVLICIHRDAEAHDLLLQAGQFGVSFLRAEQEELAVLFSTLDPDDRFRDLVVPHGPFGNPLVEGALAWMECRIHQVHPGGDHSIIVGEVLGCDAADGNPLLFFRGSLMGERP